MNGMVAFLKSTFVLPLLRLRRGQANYKTNLSLTKIE